MKGALRAWIIYALVYTLFILAISTFGIYRQIAEAGDVKPSDSCRGVAIFSNLITALR